MGTVPGLGFFLWHTSRGRARAHSCPGRAGRRGANQNVSEYQNRMVESNGSSVSDLRDKREVARNAILQLRDKITKENREFNSEERASWDAANKDYDELGEQIVKRQDRDLADAGIDVETYDPKRDGPLETFSPSRNLRKMMGGAAHRATDLNVAIH